MLATAVDEVPGGPGWAHEPKWDGFRALLLRPEGDGPVRLVSRRGNPLSACVTSSFRR
ncbi:hypothetical protein [Streptomyces sp. ICBB 8177]|uniref:hypothetical protein n=1 Tax=Streptomyces sp. ICBB 8177 TaxID=563922 RepID=UPI0013051F15|nr:hypothetical protein [Streptomyces sp. ICBB 8177]